MCEENIKSKNFFLYSGDDFSFLEFLKKGGHGTISVTSNVVPEIISEICLLVKSDFSQAKKLDDKIKNLNQNLDIIKNINKFKIEKYGLLVGTSRKSWISKIDNSLINQRLGGSIASVIYCLEKGVDIFALPLAILLEKKIRSYGATMR